MISIVITIMIRLTERLLRFSGDGGGGSKYDHRTKKTMDESNDNLISQFVRAGLVGPSIVFCAVNCAILFLIRCVRNHSWILQTAKHVIVSIGNSEDDGTFISCIMILCFGFHYGFRYTKDKYTEIRDKISSEAAAAKDAKVVSEEDDDETKSMTNLPGTISFSSTSNSSLEVDDEDDDEEDSVLKLTSRYNDSVSRIRNKKKATITFSCDSFSSEDDADDESSEELIRMSTSSSSSSSRSTTSLISPRNKSKKKSILKKSRSYDSSSTYGNCDNDDVGDVDYTRQYYIGYESSINESYKQQSASIRSSCSSSYGNDSCCYIQEEEEDDDDDDDDGWTEEQLCAMATNFSQAMVEEEGGNGNGRLSRTGSSRTFPRTRRLSSLITIREDH